MSKILKQAHEVLDHGYLRYIDHMGSDLSIVRNARVSYDAAWRAGEDSGSDKRLINYLMRNGHNTPFESGVVTIEVKLPIFVTRQWHRHRTQSYNEVSARYKELPEEFFVPDVCSITYQSDDNKQMRTVEQHPDAEEIRLLMEATNEQSFAAYRSMLNDGCPRELARSVLPVGTYTHMFATANLHNWYRFLKERLHPHAQPEIRVYAKKILAILAELFPISTEAFLNQLLDERITAEKARMFNQAMHHMSELLLGPDVVDQEQARTAAATFMELCNTQLEEIKEEFINEHS